MRTPKLIDALIGKDIKMVSKTLAFPCLDYNLAVFGAMVFQRTVRVKKSVCKVSNGREISSVGSSRSCCQKNQCHMNNLHVYQCFCRPMSPLSLYLVASLNSSSVCLASLLCADHSITHEISIGYYPGKRVTSVLLPSERNIALGFASGIHPLLVQQN